MKITLDMVGSMAGGAAKPARKKNPAPSAPDRLSGEQIVRLMRKHRVSIKALAQRMNITQARVNAVRLRGVAGSAFVRDWIEGITGADPGPAVARAANPAPSVETKKAARLYQSFTGHEPESVGKISIPPLPKSAACIGTCDGILYTTVRDGRTEKYIHQFRAKDKPLFCVSPDGKQLLLVGGAYDFTERGIVDRSDKANRT